MQISQDVTLNIVVFEMAIIAYLAIVRHRYIDNEDLTRSGRMPMLGVVVAELLIFISTALFAWPLVASMLNSTCLGAKGVDLGWQGIGGFILLGLSISLLIVMHGLEWKKTIHYLFGSARMKTINERLGSLDFVKLIQKVDTEYRKFDPAFYLYKLLYTYKQNEKFGEKFYELAYVTLVSWNMNSRGAKLSNFGTFARSIEDNKSTMEKLNGKTIRDIKTAEVRTCITNLFSGLEIVAPGKPQLVTFSKLMHFFFPELIAPIDRKYTLKFFYGGASTHRDRAKQLEQFLEIHDAFWDFESKTSLASYLDPKSWSRTSVKAMDNIIIGYYL